MISRSCPAIRRCIPLISVCIWKWRQLCSFTRNSATVGAVLIGYPRTSGSYPQWIEAMNLPLMTLKEETLWPFPPIWRPTGSKRISSWLVTMRCCCESSVTTHLFPKCRETLCIWIMSAVLDDRCAMNEAFSEKNWVCSNLVEHHKSCNKIEPYLIGRGGSSYSGKRRTQSEQAAWSIVLGEPGEIKTTSLNGYQIDTKIGKDRCAAIERHNIDHKQFWRQTDPHDRLIHRDNPAGYSDPQSLRETPRIQKILRTLFYKKQNYSHKFTGGDTWILRLT